ncbi:hypothetical protein bcgnr5385_23230 [Bacillus cereus]
MININENKIPYKTWKYIKDCIYSCNFLSFKLDPLTFKGIVDNAVCIPLINNRTDKAKTYAPYSFGGRNLANKKASAKLEADTTA